MKLVSRKHIAKQSGIGRETIPIWIKQIQRWGLLEFLEQYSNAKKGERIKSQVNPLHKIWVWEIRERELDCCGQKIKYFLEKEYGSSPAVYNIYEILAGRYQLKS